MSKEKDRPYITVDYLLGVYHIVTYEESKGEFYVVKSERLATRNKETALASARRVALNAGLDFKYPSWAREWENK